MLRLRCLRCGEWDEMNPVAHAWFGICAACVQKWYAWQARGLSYSFRQAVFFRYRKRMTKHPTYKALTEALAKTETVPHGTLDDTEAVSSW